MKRKYDLYEPSRLIRDFYSSPDAYYQAKDIRLSPFTKIGSLVDMPEPEPRANTVRSAAVAKPMHTPVFSRDFVLPGRQGIRKRDSIHTNNRMAASRPQTKIGAGTKGKLLPFFMLLNTGVKKTGLVFSKLLREPATVFGGMVYAGTHLHHVTHKYILNKPLPKHSARHTLALAEGAAVALVIVFLILMAAILKMVTPTVLPQPRTPGTGPTATNASSSQTNPTTASGSSAKTTAANSTQGTSASSQQTSTNTSFAPNPQVGASFPSATMPISSIGSVAGGMGGGPTITQTNPSPGVPGVTTPVTVTIPGQSIQGDGKQIVGTSPTTVTLN
jgi:hypothetical protein